MHMRRTLFNILKLVKTSRRNVLRCSYLKKGTACFVTFFVMMFLFTRKTELSDVTHDNGITFQASASTPVLVTVLCSGQSAGAASRQLSQAKVLTKSIAAFASAPVRLIVIGDKDLFESLIKSVNRWPKTYRAKINFEYRPAWYSKDEGKMQYMFRICSTERLFLPSILAEEDAVIYLDTDLIFMAPPSLLWNEFQRFNSNHIAALATAHSLENPVKKIFPNGKADVSAGVILMNLTRMRDNYSVNWNSNILKIYDQYHDDIDHADQDMLNIFFNKFPEKLLDLSCEYNFIVVMCLKERKKCKKAMFKGAAIVHGITYTFFSHLSRRFKVLFDEWQKFRLGSSFRTLYSSIRKNLAMVNKFVPDSRCKELIGIEEVLTKRLKILFEQ